MLISTTFMRLSLGSRIRRRLLVSATYLVLLACAVAFERGLGSAHLESSHWALLVMILIARWIFGRIVAPSVMPEPEATAVADFGLLPGRKRARPGELDERELSVRNASLFTSFRAIASWSLIVWLAVIIFMNSRAPLDQMVIRVVLVINLAIALTLPQALVLWNEPDLPEES